MVQMGIKGLSFLLTIPFIALALLVIIQLAGSSSKVKEQKQQQPRYFARNGKDLKDLAQKDYQSVATLRSLRENWRQRPVEERRSPFMTIVAKYLADFSNDNMMDGLSESEYVAEVTRNPLAMFRLIRRVALLINSMAEGRELVASIPLGQLQQDYGSDAIPLKDDLVDSAYGILRIQFMYNLTASDLAAGKVKGIETRVNLLAVHCLYIALIAKFRMEHTVAVEWLLEARRLAKIDGTADIPSVQTELIDIIKEHDKHWSRQDFTDEYFFMKPLRSLHVLDTGSVPSVRDVLQSTYGGKGRNSSYWPMNTWGLCSGKDFHTAGVASHLFCWLEFKVNRIFSMGPLKMEFLSRNPDVVQIHDAFTESDVKDAMTAVVIGDAFSSGLWREIQEQELYLSDGYLDSSSSSGFNLGHIMMERQINEKLEAMTGLRSSECNASHRAKVINHIPGGSEDIQEELQALLQGGDRIATFMIQLNNVEEGGYTVFPASFAAAVPSKGSAIFWFNTFSDGSPDFSTVHAHCPVVLGQKWAIRKWIGFKDQFSVRKCLRMPKERLKVLVNGKVLPVRTAFKHQPIEEERIRSPKPLSVILEAPPEYHNVVLPRKKYANRPSSAVKLLVRLDWEIYQKVKRIYAVMKHPVNMQLERPQASNQMIRRYLEDFNETAYKSILETDQNDMEAVEKLAGNPLAVYRTFWRFENYVKPWVTQVFHNEHLVKFRHIRDCIANVYNPSDGPLGLDLEDAMTGILNLQFVHDLKSDEIAEGLVAGVDAGIVLSAKQCIEIGHQAIARDFYYQAIDWMATALSKTISRGDDDTVDLKDAQIELEAAKKTHDRFLHRPTTTATERTFYVHPVAGLRSLAHIQTRKGMSHLPYAVRNESQFMDINWMEVCQGKRRQTPAEMSKLFCWYEREVHPYFKIRPIKMEIHSMHPKSEVVEYHDVLGEELTAYLRNDSGREFVVSTTEGYGVTDPRVRISAAYFLYKDEQFRRLRNLVTLVTGLKTGLASLNLNSYTTGGHFAPHKDAGGVDVSGPSTTMATFMFYITETEKGGGTAFAEAHVHVTPKAGSAVLWYNTLTSGDPDLESHHGGCPIIFGEKRIATQFLSLGDQSHLQCHGDRPRKMEVLVNGKSKYNV